VRHIEFAPAARAELDAAADRYELERPGRGLRFYAAVERATKLIAAFPHAGPPFPGVGPISRFAAALSSDSRSCSPTALSRTRFASTPSHTRTADRTTGSAGSADLPRSWWALPGGAHRFLTPRDDDPM